MEIANNILNSGKKYLNAMVGLGRLEANALLSRAGRQTLDYAIVLALLTLAVFWISALALRLLERVMSTELSMVVVAATLFVVAWVVLASSKREAQRAADKVKNKVSEFAEKSFEGDDRLGVLQSCETSAKAGEKPDNDERISCYKREMDAAKEEIMGAAKDMKVAAVESLHPVNMVHNVVERTPKSAVIGAIALGALWGLRNSKAPSATINSR